MNLSKLYFKVRIIKKNSSNMKSILTSFMVVASLNFSFAQAVHSNKYFIGASYGKSLSLGDFGDTDFGNPDAGFADDGNRLDVFGGYFLNQKITLNGTFRYQTFDNEIESLIQNLNAENPEANFSGNTEKWIVYSVLVGLSYKVKVYRKFSLFRRFAIRPMLVINPGISISSPNSLLTQNFIRSSESGNGFGYEFGIGFIRDIEKRFALMPTFTISGGLATIRNVNTTTDNALVISDYDVNIQSFNYGLSIAYKFI